MLANHSSDNDTMIELQEVSFGYGERRILHNLNLRIPKGKVVAIMGGSGCGKTTILRLIGGQLYPNSGDVLVDGHSIPGMSTEQLFQLRRKIGMLFQMGALFTDMSVFDNIAFQIREHTDVPESLINYLVLMKLQTVGLRGASQLMPSELSGGMARRVALARAVALDPQLMLYDEPFTGLDPISLNVIGQLIRRLNDALGTTSVVVTHNVRESLKVVDHIYLISEGAVIVEGSVDDILASDHPFVHQFIGSKLSGPVPFHYKAPDYRKMLIEGLR